MIHRAFITLVLMLATTGCTVYSIDSQSSSDVFYPSKASTQQVIYLEKIAQPHEVIGTVIVNAERRQSVSEVIEKMKYEAAILGGDAITDIKSNAGGTWKKLPPEHFLKNAYLRSDLTATVVIFKK